MATKNKDFGKFSNFRRMFLQRILVDGSEERKEGDREKDAFFFSFTKPIRRNRNTDYEALKTVPERGSETRRF